jgi:hypothetical protein
MNGWHLKVKWQLCQVIASGATVSIGRLHFFSQFSGGWRVPHRAQNLLFASAMVRQKYEEKRKNLKF